MRQLEVFSVPPQTQEKGISTIAKKSLIDYFFVAFQPSKEFYFFGWASGGRQRVGVGAKWFSWKLGSAAALGH